MLFATTVHFCYHCCYQNCHCHQGCCQFLSSQLLIVSDICHLEAGTYTAREVIQIVAKSTLGTRKNGVPPGLRFWALPGNAAMQPKFTKVGPFPRCYHAGSACTVSVSLGSSLWPTTLTCLPPYPLEVLPVSFPSILGRNSVLAQAVEYHIYKQYRSLGQEDPLGKGMATQSSILAWRIPLL